MTTTASTSPNRLSRSAVSDLCALLSSGFHEDALTRWMIPDERLRAELLPGFFHVFVELCAAHEGVLTTPDGDAVLLFLPPGADPDERALDTAFAGVLGGHTDALRTITRLQAQRHPRQPPHYYVLFGAVRTERQRGGLLSGLISGLLACADAEAAGVYAEASSPGGEAAGRRAGFRLLGREIVLPDGGPALRPMWRDPR